METGVGGGAWVALAVARVALARDLEARGVAWGCVGTGVRAEAVLLLGVCAVSMKNIACEVVSRTRDTICLLFCVFV